MGTVKRKWGRWVASGLSAVLLVTNLPLSTIAEANTAPPEKEIIYFAELPERVAIQEVPKGTPVGDLNLPKSIKAVVFTETVPEDEPETSQKAESVVETEKTYDSEETTVANGWQALKQQTLTITLTKCLTSITVD